MPRPPLRPFLKWAGGKRQLLPELRRYVPRTFGAYYEPFFGSGALFFDLAARGCLQSKAAYLIDTNADLIGCCRALARDVESVIAALDELAVAHVASPEEHYYDVRDRRFNPARRGLPDDTKAAAYPAQLAAMFIYLNRTGFNGLYRLNAAGEFNVPAGRYTKPRICDADNLRAVAAALGTPGVELRHAKFDTVLDTAQPADFLYFDPPYAPVSVTAAFTSYTAARFDEADQRRLQQVAVELASRRCRVLLSNSTAEIVVDLYDRDRTARRAGLQPRKVSALRAINSNAARRGPVLEYIVSNVRPRAG